MVFFLDAQQRVLGRYGARNADDSDSLQSLAGLRYAMQEALALHRQRSTLPAAEAAADAPSGTTRPGTPRPDTASSDAAGSGATPMRFPPSAPLRVRDLPAARDIRGCVHCHDVKEVLRAEAQAAGVWTHSDLFRYPPTENIGITLNIDRGSEITAVLPDSPADRAGLQAGDRMESLNRFRVRSIADAQFALDRSPPQGRIAITWTRSGAVMGSELDLPADWRRSDISWRPSMQQYVALPRLYGTDLSAEERRALGLTPGQLAFRHRKKIHRQAQPAGVRPGDIILGFDGRQLDLDVYDFEKYVRRHYVAGDRVMINLIRDGRRLALPMTILPLY